MGLFSRAKTKDHNKRPRGRFIVIDGTDGSGKATQTELLAKTLSVSGYDGVVFDFPQYNTSSAAMLEKYLRGKYGDMNAQAASILYAIDRFDASFRIREYLADGKIVLANRYVTSNAAHQGSKIEDPHDRLKFYKWLDNLEFTIFGIPKPDLNIILHIPHEVSWKLIEDRAKADGRKKDIHESDAGHLKRAEEVYLEIAELFPNMKVVECMDDNRLMSPQEVQGKVWELVRRIALKNITPHI